MKFLAILAVAAGIFVSSALPASAATLADLANATCTSQTNCLRVINIPVNGTSVPWLVSSYIDGNYVLVMSMANLCAISATNCRTPAGAASSFGMAWNNTSATAYSSKFGNPYVTLRYNYLARMNTIYGLLPTVIGGLPRGDAVRSTTWDMDGFSNSTSASSRSNDFNIPWTGRLNLPSYYEWQRGRDNGTSAPSLGWQTEPAARSLGDLFAWTRFNRTSFKGSNFSEAANPSPLTGNYGVAWLRSPRSDIDSGVWAIYGSSTASIDVWSLSGSNGLMPVMWLRSDIQTLSGTGTYASPYQLLSNEAPVIHDVVWNNENWIASAVDVSGLLDNRKSGSSVQTVTLSYQWNGTGGNWTTITGISHTGNLTNHAWSRSISTPSTTGEHTLYLRACDNGPFGGLCSELMSAVFQVDRTAPVCPAMNETNWSPYPAPWQPHGTTTFTMSGATDLDSGIQVAGGTCTTGNTNNSTCADTLSGGTGRVRIRDNAGNTMTCDSPVNRLDNEAPTVPTVSGGSEEYTNAASVAVRVAGSIDLPSGDEGLDNAGLRAPNPYSYELSGAQTSAEATYSGEISITSEGVTYVNAYAFDNILAPAVANKSAAGSTVVRIDRTPPTVEVTESGGEKVGDVYQTSPTLTVTAVDPPNASNASNASGVAGLAIAWTDTADKCNSLMDPSDTANFAGFEASPATTQIPAEGVHVLCSRSLDGAGNLSAIHTNTYELSTPSPTLLITLNPPPPTIVHDWFLSEPNYILTARDNNGAGIASLKYLLIPTSEVLANSSKYGSNYDLSTDSDARIVTVTTSSNPALLCGGEPQVCRFNLSPPTITEGNYTLFAVAISNSATTKPSPTDREKIAVDKQIPVNSVSFADEIEPLANTNPNYNALNKIGVTGLIHQPNANLRLSFFDPLSSDLSQAPSDQMMTSGVNICTLQYRSVPIRTDGSGLLQADAQGNLLWSDWTTDGDYTMTNCAPNFEFVAPQEDAAYIFRFQVVDVAQRHADFYYPPTLLYNLLTIFEPEFNDLNDNVPDNLLASNVFTVNCDDMACTGKTLTFPATMIADSAATNYQVCLEINGAAEAKTCTTITSSTTATTHYNLVLDISKFTQLEDVFIGGILATTPIGEGATTQEKIANVIIRLNRGRPQINPAAASQNYIHTDNSVLN